MGMMRNFLVGLLRTVPTNKRYFSPVCDYAGNVDLKKAY